MTRSRRLAKPRNLRQRHAAGVGIFAILLQALLFGWHHHAEHFSVTGQWPMLSVSAPSAPLSPATTEDECELCAALHYLTAAPGEFILAGAPSSGTLLPPQLVQARPGRQPRFSFRARAPPLA
jgi:hypothetical protein